MKTFVFIALVTTAMSFSSPGSAESTRPQYGLTQGATAPNFLAKDIHGDDFDLSLAVKKGPVVLVFYRGGWCPYCNLQLQRLQGEVAAAARTHKGTLVAVSVDLPQEGLKSEDKHKLSFKVISDPDAKILNNYRVAYRVPEDLVAKYKNEYKIDLEKASGNTRHVIAVPAVYVIDGRSKIQYSFVDENYKVRAPSQEIVEAIKKASAVKL